VKWVEELAPMGFALSLHFGGRFCTNEKEKCEIIDVVSEILNVKSLTIDVSF